MTAQEMIARIAVLEAELSSKPKAKRSNRSAEKAAAKARKAQFKLEAFKRARLHCTLNRYHI